MKAIKKGQVGVITTVVLLVVALVAVSIFWLTTRGLLNKQTEQLTIDCTTVNLKIIRAVTGEDNLTIKREVGDGGLSSVKVLIDGEIVKEADISLAVLNSTVIELDNSLATGEKVEIASVVKTTAGKSVPCGVVDAFTVE
ncbi:MAG: hypothetical protein AABX65_02925 [Nanoarchaeota archaeon]